MRIPLSPGQAEIYALIKEREDLLAKQGPLVLLFLPPPFALMLLQS